MRPVWRSILAIVAGLLVTILVAAGVTLAILRIESRTNPQQVNLQPGVTLTQDSAIVQAAAKGRSAAVIIYINGVLAECAAFCAMAQPRPTGVDHRR